jgi:peptidoglycan/xylan/chitin deacetylase (PgdA/CDA1 family)
MKILSQIRRNLIVPALYHAQNSLFGGPGAKGKSVIINYHGVVREPFVKVNNRHVFSNQFEEDLRFFSKYFEVVPLSVIFDIEDSESASSFPKLAITFDDGFANNFLFAVPLLVKYNLPASIFVLSASIEDREFINWPDLLDVMAIVPGYEEIDFLGGRYIHTSLGYINLEDPSDTLTEAIKKSGSERTEVLNFLSKNFLSSFPRGGPFGDSLNLMNSLQIRECSNCSLIEIGSHSKNHFNLGQVPLDLAKYELAESKRVIENVIQKDVKSVAYPDGDYSADVKDLAECLGYSRQLAVDLRLEEDRFDSRIRGRFGYSNSTTHMSNQVRLGFQWGKYSF